MQISYTKILIGSGLLLGLALIVKYNVKYNKYNKYIKTCNPNNNPDNLQPTITKLDKTTSVSNLKNNDINKSDANNSDTNDIETQTVVTLDKNDRFLVKETIVGDGNKWYDIIDESIHNIINTNNNK